jgi:hypothetical protein
MASFAKPQRSQWPTTAGVIPAPQIVPRMAASSAPPLPDPPPRRRLEKLRRPLTALAKKPPIDASQYPPMRMAERDSWLSRSARWYLHVPAETSSTAIVGPGGYTAGGRPPIQHFGRHRRAGDGLRLEWLIWAPCITPNTRQSSGAESALGGTPWRLSRLTNEVRSSRGVQPYPLPASVQCH